LYTEIFVSIGWTIFTFVAGWSGRKWTRHRQEVRPAARVWQIDPKIPLHIVTADPAAVDAKELTPIVYPAEYTAATELSLYLKQVFKREPDISSGTEFLKKKECFGDNIVIIGGPNHNPIYRKYYAHLKDRFEEKAISLPYSFNKESALIRHSDNYLFEAEVDDEEGEISVDYGLVMLAANPYNNFYNNHARVVFLAGCMTYGCLAAARAVEAPYIRETAGLVHDREIVAFVVRTRMTGQYPGPITIIPDPGA
jgi:hypothetical protein